MLLILAGISIQMLTGNNGILTRAGDAKEYTETGKETEEISLAWSPVVTNSILDDKEITNSDFEKELKKYDEKVRVINKDDTTFLVHFDATKHIYEVNKNGNIELTDLVIPALQEMEPTEKIYVKLYTDGTLAFSSDASKIIEGKSVSNSYEINKGDDFDEASKNPWFNNRPNVKSVIFLDPIAPISTKRWFVDCNNLADITNMKNLNTCNVISMNRMFYNCFNLSEIKLDYFNTCKVKDMGSMFYDCIKLSSLDLSSFNTNKVTDMSWMFCAGDSNQMALTEIKGIEKFDTSNVTTMRAMFYDCIKLSCLDLSSFNTSKVEDMSYMFGGGESTMNLTEIKGLENFDTSNVTDMEAMFQNCTKLSSLDLSSFNTSKVTNMSFMFGGTNQMALTEIKGLEKFDTRNVTDMYCMFQHCQKLTKLDLSSFDTSEVKDMTYMFSRCIALNTIYASDKWNTDKVTSSSKMFNNCTSLKGQNNTTYNSSKIDKTYACIDTAEHPGYLSLKPVQ